MSCPSDEELARRPLSPQTLGHLADCEACRIVVSVSGESEPVPAEVQARAPRPARKPTTRRRVVSRPWGRWAAAAAILIALAVILLNLPRPQPKSEAPVEARKTRPIERPNPANDARPQRDSLRSPKAEQPPLEKEELVERPDPTPDPEREPARVETGRPKPLRPGKAAAVAVEDAQGELGISGLSTVDARTEISAGSRGGYLRLAGRADVWLLPGSKAAFHRTAEHLAIDVRSGEVLCSSESEIQITSGETCILVRGRASLSIEREGLAIHALSGPLVVRLDSEKTERFEAGRGILLAQEGAARRELDPKLRRGREALIASAPARRSLLAITFDADAFPPEKGRYEIAKGRTLRGLLKAEDRVAAVALRPALEIDKPVIVSFRFRTDSARVRVTFRALGESAVRTVKADRDGWCEARLTADGGMVGFTDRALPIDGIEWSCDGTYLEIDDLQVAPK